MRNPFSILAQRPDKSLKDPDSRVVIAIAAIIMLVAFVGAVIVCLTSLPITEGWYETLIYLEKHGLKAYSTAAFVLPPVTILDFRLLDFITRSNFAANRLIGLLVTLLDAGMLFYWLRQFVSISAAAFASAFIFTIMTTQPIYIPGDYHDIVQLFLTIGLWLLLTPAIFDKSPLKTATLVRIIAAGAIVQMLLLTKQNVGLMLFIGFAILLVANFLRSAATKAFSSTKKIAVLGIAYTLAFTLTGIIFLKLFDPSSSFWSRYVSFFLIGSKGSAFYASTRIIHDGNNLQTIVPGFLIAAFISLTITAFLYIKKRIQIQKNAASAIGSLSIISEIRSNSLTILLALSPIILTLIVLNGILSASNIFLWDLWPCIFTFTCYFLDIITTSISVSRNKNQDGFAVTRIILFGMVLFGHSMTAALNIVGMAIFFAYYLAICTEHSIQQSRKLGIQWQHLTLIAVSIATAVFTTKLELTKLSTPYSWWGMQEPPVFSSSAKTTLPYLSGMHLTADRMHMIESIVHVVDHETQPTDRILVYPHMPIFYMLTNRLPETTTYVQWFDFATNDTLLPDFRKISQSPPKVIVEMSLPQTVYTGHESLLGRVVPQRPFSAYIQCMTDNGAYQEINRFFYNRSDALQGTYSLRSDNAVSPETIDALAAHAAHYNAASFVVTGGLALDGTVVPLADIQKIADQRAAGFGGFVVSGNSDELPKFLQFLQNQTHIKLKPAYDNFILRVLKRQPKWENSQAQCPTVLQSALDNLAENK